MEYRIKDVQLQIKDENIMKIGGYINVTERESEMLYSRRDNTWFIETMKKGVFQRAIERIDDIPLLFEHDWDKKLASTRCKNLVLKEDNIGLKFEAILESRNVYEQVRAGVINSCSFGFNPISQEKIPVNSRLEKRFVTEIELLEVSLVKNPAYVGSLAETRAYEEELERSKPSTEEEEVKDVEDEQEAEDIIEDKKDESEEAKEEAAEEVVEEKDEESKDDDSDETEERELPVSVLGDGCLIEKNPIDKESIKAIVDELVQEKLNQIRMTEEEEKIAIEQLEDVKEFHQEVESDYAAEVNLKNFQLMKMRLDLLKLQNLKDGI